MTPFVGEKILPVAVLLEPAVGFTKGENIRGYVPLPAQVRQET